MTIELCAPPDIAEVDLAVVEAGVQLVVPFLSDHNLTDLVALASLHGHFEVRRRETLLETIDSQGVQWVHVANKRRARIYPVSTLRFAPNGRPAVMSRCDATRGQAHIVPNSSGHRNLERAAHLVGRYLAEHQLTEVLALQALDTLPQLKPNYVLFEVTDRKRRRQKTEAVQRETVDFSMGEPTVWAFRDGKLITMGWCDGKQHDLPKEPMKYCSKVARVHN